MNELVQIFTFHDHLFKIVRIFDDGDLFLEDEYGTRALIKDAADLKALREACALMLQGYREEMSMPGANS